MYSAIEHYVNMALYKCCILLLFFYYYCLNMAVGLDNIHVRNNEHDGCGPPGRDIF